MAIQAMASAGDNSPEPKRNLQRWNAEANYKLREADAMDKQLLLSTQAACNEVGIKIPWDRVGVLMQTEKTRGPISEGSIVQHLAKMRSRMVQEGLPVPPPLKRGGQTRISPQSYQSSHPKQSVVAAPRAEPAVKSKRARKPTVEEDSDDDSWQPRRRSQPSNKKAKKDVEHIGYKSPTVEDSDDNTISDASEGFVGSRAAFLPTEGLVSSPKPSTGQGSRTITLDWGNAYPDNAGSYAIAANKLVTARVIPQKASQVSVAAGKEDAKAGTHEEDLEGDTEDEDAGGETDEEYGPEEPPVETIDNEDNAPQNYSLGHFQEVPTTSAEASRACTIPSDTAQLTDSNGRPFRNGLFTHENRGNSYFNAPVIDTSAHLGGFSEAYPSNTTAQPRYLDQRLLSATGHAPGPTFHQNHVPTMYVRPDDLVLNGSPVFDRDFPYDPSSSPRRNVRRFLGRMKTQLNNVDTITSQSSSTNALFPAYMPDNNQTAYPFETGLQNIGNHLGGNEPMLGYDASHFDASFPQTEYNVDSMNTFPQPEYDVDNMNTFPQPEYNVDNMNLFDDVQ